ncbi:hypothetical protein KQX54_008078 [Cotesia glomerata]|uniref:Uncharacterized protein n=1 Tax=Cotesia glomerata TaxID=32391 RepID=A0AAV7I6B1_COTGL|nr:hypothetical protein KQX54_008078 [Cotesia glomerata]
MRTITKRETQTNEQYGSLSLLVQPAFTIAITSSDDADGNGDGNGTGMFGTMCGCCRCALTVVAGHCFINTKQLGRAVQSGSSTSPVSRVSDRENTNLDFIMKTRMPEVLPTYIATGGQRRTGFLPPPNREDLIVPIESRCGIVKRE